MNAPIWVETNLVLEMHRRLITRYGGLGGVRDFQLLESALARPRHIATYTNTDLLTLATAYVGGIIRNHPFIDGNKRVAFMTCYTFLASNGLQLTASPLEATEHTLGLSTRTITEEDYTIWLKENIIPPSPVKQIKR